MQRVRDVIPPGVELRSADGEFHLDSEIWCQWCERMQPFGDLVIEHEEESEDGSKDVSLCCGFDDCGCPWLQPNDPAGAEPPA